MFEGIEPCDEEGNTLLYLGHVTDFIRSFSNSGWDYNVSVILWLCPGYASLITVAKRPIAST